MILKSARRTHGSSQRTAQGQRVSRGRALQRQLSAAQAQQGQQVHGVVLRTGKALRSHSLLHALTQRVQICIAAHLGGQAGLACLLNIGNRLVAFSQQASAFSIDFLQVGARIFGFMARALQGLVFLAASLLHRLTAQGGEVLFRRVHLHDQRQTLGFQILNLAVHGGGNSVRAAACQLLIQDILHARQAQHMRHSLTLHLRQRPQSAE